MTVTDLLDATAEIVQTAEAPVDTDDARRLLTAIHGFDAALDLLHDAAAAPIAPLDVHGRCIDCGRLVARSAGIPHKRRSYLSLIFSLVFAGRALWLLSRRRRSRATPVPPAGGREGTWPLPVVLSAVAGRGAGANHQKGEQ